MAYHSHAVTCVWFDKTRLQRDLFPIEVIQVPINTGGAFLSRAGNSLSAAKAGKREFMKLSDGIARGLCEEAFVPATAERLSSKERARKSPASQGGAGSGGAHPGVSWRRLRRFIVAHPLEQRHMEGHSYVLNRSEKLDLTFQRESWT
jgi:hypothetical protein